MRVILDQYAAVYYPTESRWPAREESVSVRRRDGESDGDLLEALARAVKAREPFDAGAPALPS